MKSKKQVKPKTSAEELTLASPQHPALGIDIDGTIDEAPEFFSILTTMWKGKIIIISYRDNLAKAQEDVQSHGVRFDEIVLVNSFKQKAEVIRERNIKVFFDDMDEVIMHIPGDVKVFKVRNDGNFCNISGRWFYSEKTGELV